MATTQIQEDLSVRKDLAHLHHHRLRHRLSTAAPTFVTLVALAVLLVVVHLVHFAVMTKAVVRRGKSAGEYLVSLSAPHSEHRVGWVSFLNPTIGLLSPA